MTGSGSSPSSPRKEVGMRTDMKSVVGAAIVLVLLAVLLHGFGSMRPGPPTPITSMGQIEGKWRGTLTAGFAGPEVLYYFTIQPKGQYVADWASARNGAG